MRRMGFQGGLVALLCAALAIGCDDGGGAAADDADAAAPDGGGRDTGPPPKQCADGRDNDGDGETDGDDPGCAGADDDDESDDPPPKQCGNGTDDDQDGAADFPADRGCASRTDDDESDDPTTECSDDVDNDQDGFTDFPADPGCGSALDDREGDDTTPLPQCGDGLDNDRDGHVDLADPGCGSAADPREQEVGEPPACADGLDNDDDGIVDFPREPGCSAAGDEDEADPDPPPACANGRDDDGDDAVDYPDDPGCSGVGDRDETDPIVMPTCSDGLDNDRDGHVDYPADRGCQSAADGSEEGSCGSVYDPPELTAGRVLRADLRRGRFAAQGSCGGVGAPEMVFFYRVERALEALEFTTAHAETVVETVLYVRRACLDGGTEVACAREPGGDGVAANTVRVDHPQPGDYYLFVDGAAGRGDDFAVSATEVPLAQCLNGDDDDADGRADYPLDPGCEAPEDRDETDPEIAPACADDEDNDGDGLVDYPIDRGCLAAADDDEVDVCGQGVRVLEIPSDAEFVLGDTAQQGASNFFGRCGGQNANEVVYRYRNPHNARLTFSVDNPETPQAAIVYVRSSCVQVNTELGCDAGNGVPPRGQVRVDRASPGDYFVFVDAQFGQGGPFKLTVRSERLPPGCRDAFDNDGDGFIDGDDLGCAEADDEDERDPPAGSPAPACWNQQDDDGDGATDYPFDIGCATKGDADEADGDAPPACSNGLDDDEDGRVDFPLDAGCQARGDDEERNPIPPPQCGNSLDDDMDGRTDYPSDPGCDAAGDPSERDGQPRPACANGEDDDRDGLVDFPFDPGCIAASHRAEDDPVEPPVCKNARDDDEDGATDFPRDPGCAYAADGDEANPQFVPQCANRRDDDADMRIDFPDDPGCEFAADNDEANMGQVRPRCADGVDNDDDGGTDLADVGCDGPRDDDEADLEVVPFCADEIDNDEDGQTDWPDDEGCAARGDDCEQAGWGLCEGVCLDLVSDEQNCGRCGRVCEDGVECIEGFCGGLFVFEGILNDVPEADLGGWEVCHRSLYAETWPLAPIQQQCDGQYVMYGCRRVGQASFQVLAMGERDAVFRDTGRGNDLNVHNGVGWYFGTSQSIGFAAPGQMVARNSCDTAGPMDNQRICWHTNNSQMSGGFRCGSNMWLNDARDWERVIFTSR